MEGGSGDSGCEGVPESSTPGCTQTQPAHGGWEGGRGSWLWAPACSVLCTLRGVAPSSWQCQACQPYLRAWCGTALIRHGAASLVDLSELARLFCTTESQLRDQCAGVGDARVCQGMECSALAGCV